VVTLTKQALFSGISSYRYAQNSAVAQSAHFSSLSSSLQVCIINTTKFGKAKVVYSVWSKDGPIVVTF
jgi:hypothetical protein